MITVTDGIWIIEIRAPQRPDGNEATQKGNTMTETIFDAVIKDLGRDSEWFNGHEPDPSPETTKGTPPMSVITDLNDAVASGISNIEGWTADLRNKLPQLAARAQKLDASPIVQALDELGADLPPAFEQDIANLIRHYATSPTTAAATTPQPAAPAAS